MGNWSNRGNEEIYENGDDRFLYREYDENFEHKLGEDFGLYPTIVHHEKIVELRWEHLL